jgi:hypothetical protein
VAARTSSPFGQLGKLAGLLVYLGENPLLEHFSKMRPDVAKHQSHSGGFNVNDRRRSFKVLARIIDPHLNRKALRYRSSHFQAATTEAQLGYPSREFRGRLFEGYLGARVKREPQTT